MFPDSARNGVNLVRGLAGGRHDDGPSGCREALRGNAVAAVLLGDARRDCIRRRDVGIGASDVGLAPLGEPPAVERVGLLRLDAKRRVIVLDGAIDLTELQVDEAAAVEGIAVIRPQAQRLVTVLEGGVQVAGEGPGEAAGIPGRGVPGTEDMTSLGLSRIAWS